MIIEKNRLLSQFKQQTKENYVDSLKKEGKKLFVVQKVICCNVLNLLKASKKDIKFSQSNAFLLSLKVTFFAKFLTLLSIILTEFEQGVTTNVISRTSVVDPC